MAVKDVIGRGIGPSSALLYFITGGFSTGVGVVTITNMRLVMSAPEIQIRQIAPEIKLAQAEQTIVIRG